ncbi:MAG: hypothetical protein ACOYOU_05640, partial [Kiritimatiellia bacterium]
SGPFRCRADRETVKLNATHVSRDVPRYCAGLIIDEGGRVRQWRTRRETGAAARASRYSAARKRQHPVDVAGDTAACAGRWWLRRGS